MSAYRSFTVVGYGMLGAKVVATPARKNAEDDQARDELASQGVELRVVSDYVDPTSLETALRGSDVVISTISGDAIAAQPTIARAAKAGGAQLFVPSDFGSDLDGHQNMEGVFGMKSNLKTVLRDEFELPFVSFNNGGFPDYFFAPNIAPAFGFDFVNGKFAIQGSGEATNSYTAMSDVAKFVVQVLTTFPKEKLEWRIFRIESERVSWNDIISAWAARTGRRADVTHCSIAETQAKLKVNPLDFASFLIVTFDAGKGSVGAPEVSNAEWPEWESKSVVDAIIEMYS